MSTTGLLNPLTPLAYLPHDAANQLEISRYTYALTLGVSIRFLCFTSPVTKYKQAYLWDIAINLGNDYHLLFQSKIRFPTIVYYASRMSTLTYILTTFIFQVGRVQHCQALQIALGVCYVLSTSLTSLLFLFRVQAVYHQHKHIKRAFFVLWLLASATTVVVPVGISGSHIGPTQQCINTRIEQYTQAAAIASMVNDTAVFLAISYQILMYSVAEESWTARMKIFFGRAAIPNSSVAQLLLQGGQHYYLIAVCGNLLVLIFVRLENAPQIYRGISTGPVLALVNMMACIVFRKIKFGLITNDGCEPLPLTPLNFRATYNQYSGGGTLPSHYESQGEQNFGDTPVYPLARSAGKDGLLISHVDADILVKETRQYDG
ncbi:hypothetical protein BDQ12DRAFT_437693 [Crucibulum laeve]|uniref:Uncharacterized protein n=1 Tax=Crucibulum laeve TaxID=68775 RepID=A0A5C3M9K2_9AGAR|nr:hypothetical protein BDQ12DRAFT_437693 [Crucibulum laeve]